MYLGNPPTSDVVVACGGVEIAVPNNFLNGNLPSTASRWRRALLKLTKVPKEEAQSALLDLPEVFADTDAAEADTTRIEIRLFEFNDIGGKSFHPVLVVGK